MNGSSYFRAFLDLILDVPGFYWIYPITFISFSLVLGPVLLWNYPVVEVKPGHSLASSCPTYVRSQEPSCASAYGRSLHRSTILSTTHQKWQVILSTGLFTRGRRSRLRERDMLVHQRQAAGCIKRAGFSPAPLSPFFQ